MYMLYNQIYRMSIELSAIIYSKITDRYLLSTMLSFISIMSLRIALAVSIPPAPRPIIVCLPECSDEKVTAFNVPLTHNGSIFDTSIGFTLRFLLSHVAISFMALPLL